jgi:hypothetical protein
VPRDAHAGGGRPERRGVAVNRAEAELVVVGLGHVGELHPEQVARSGERPLDRGLGALARRRGERVEWSGNRPADVQYTVDCSVIGSEVAGMERIVQCRPAYRPDSQGPQTGQGVAPARS